VFRRATGGRQPWRDKGLAGEREGASRNLNFTVKELKHKGYSEILISFAFPLPAASRSWQGISQRGKQAAVMISSSVQTVARDPVPKSQHLAVRLAQNAADLDAAQALRYEVFYTENGARPSPEQAALQRDFDPLDAICDHLLVIDESAPPGPDAVVGTYRLLRRSRLVGGARFYSSGEFDLSPLLAFPGEALELGRSCVRADYRNRPTLNLLWAGIAAYMQQHGVALMFGCGSLAGTDLDQLSLQLAYLHHHHLAPPELRARALADRRVAMDRMPAALIEPKLALAALPPLIKGYLRLGGFVGEGAVVDHAFNTTDVCIIVKTETVTDKYLRHYERQAIDLGRAPSIANEVRRLT
jgi:putative hemolysin